MADRSPSSTNGSFHDRAASSMRSAFRLFSESFWARAKARSMAASFFPPRPERFIASYISSASLGGSAATLAPLSKDWGTSRAQADVGPLPNASILVHQPLGGFQGQASDIERHAEDIIKTKRRMGELYARHCGRTPEEVERTLDRDFFMTAEEAKAWGIVDHIYERRVPPMAA